MVLTARRYIIDRYDTLPGITVFLHASRFQWHNDNPDYDGLLSMRNLSLSYIQEEGYVNLRCVWVLGCPVEIRPAKHAFEASIKEPDHELEAKDIYKAAFEELLPDNAVPEEVGVPCCSQFAVTRETIRRRPREDYVRFRDWLIKTKLDDSLSGRVLEYSWHSTFPQPSGGETDTDVSCSSHFRKEGGALPFREPLLLQALRHV